MADSYLQDILSGQAQKEITGGGKLTPQQIEAAFQGDINARYQAEAKERQLNIEQQRTNIAAGESALRSKSEGAKETIGMVQTGVNTAAAVGNLALGGAKLFSATKGTETLGEAAFTPSALETTATPGETAAFGQPLLTADPALMTAAEATPAASIGAGAAEGGAAAVEGASATGEAAASTEVAGAVGDSIISYITEALGSAAAAWVLCSELVRQNKLGASIVEEEWSYIQKLITREEYIGYRILADPLVKLMQNSIIFTEIITPFIRGFAYEMAGRVNPSVKRNCLGKLLLIIGLPLCRLTYKVAELFFILVGQEV